MERQQLHVNTSPKDVLDPRSSHPFPAKVVAALKEIRRLERTGVLIRWKTL
jgi:hypothetical protein